MKSGQVIYLNGPSSSGKTTLAHAIQDVFNEPFLSEGSEKTQSFRSEMNRADSLTNS